MDFENLSAELKERARACKSSEELSALAAEVGIELTDEELEGMSGGSWATKCPKEGCSDYNTREYCETDRHPCYHDGML